MLKIKLKFSRSAVPLGGAEPVPMPAPPILAPPALPPKRVKKEKKEKDKTDKPPPRKRKKKEEPPAPTALGTEVVLDPAAQPPPEKKKRERKKKDKPGPGKSGAGGEDDGGEGKPIPLTKKAADTILEKIRKQDTLGIFAEPVTEDIAPGYFAVVSKPMDLHTMRQNLTKSVYQTWDVLWEDLEVMFTNAMKYNDPETIFYQQARVLLGNAKKMVEKEKKTMEKKLFEKEAKRRAKAGLSTPGASGMDTGPDMSVGGYDATSAPQLSTQAGGWGYGYGGPGGGGGALGGDGGDDDGDCGGGGNTMGSRGGNTSRPIVTPFDGRRPLSREEYKRVTYQATLGGDLGALGGGATGDGIPYDGRVVLRSKPLHALPPNAFVSSLTRFAARLGPRARARAEALAKACLDCSAAHAAGGARAGAGMMPVHQHGGVNMQGLAPLGVAPGVGGSWDGAPRALT